MYGQQKANIVLDNVMYAGENIAFCAPTTSFSAFLIEKACAWTTKDKYYITSDHVYNICARNKEYVQTIGGFSAGKCWKQAFLQNNRLKNSIETKQNIDN